MHRTKSQVHVHSNVHQSNFDVNDSLITFVYGGDYNGILEYANIISGYTSLRLYLCVLSWCMGLSSDFCIHVCFDPQLCLMI